MDCEALGQLKHEQESHPACMWNFGEQDMLILDPNEDPLQTPPAWQDCLGIPGYPLLKKIGYNYILSEAKDDVDEAELHDIFSISEGEDILHPDWLYGHDTRNECWMTYSPSCEERCPTEDPQLPRVLPENLHLSQALLLIGETKHFSRVFLFNLADGSLYHVCRKRAKESQSQFFGSNGYAAIDGKLYFIGGCFDNHDHQLSYLDAASSLGVSLYDDDDHTQAIAIEAEAALIRSRNLEVEFLDLKTKRLGTSISKLNDPKPNPTVFVYNEKIYVIAGPSLLNHCCKFDFVKPGPLPESTMIECLKPGESTWTKLPNPPFSRDSFCPYLLDTSKGILLVAVDTSTTLEKEVDSYQLFEFNLTSHEWKFHSLLHIVFKDEYIGDPLRLSYLPPYYEVPTIPRHRLLLSYLPPYYEVETIPRHTSCYGTPAYFFAGCTVENFLFCFDTGTTPGAPSILVHDLSSKGLPPAVCCRVDLSEALKGFVRLDSTNGYLNHLGGHMFCLAIIYITETKPIVNAVCILTFELQKTSVVQSEATAHQPKQPRAEKSSFSLVTHQCRTFQLPIDVQFTFCKKLEG